MVQLNLSRDSWLVIRDHDDVMRRIAPSVIGNPDLHAIDTGRPDFDGALTQFLIALLQTTFAPRDKREWRDRLLNPPGAPDLEAAFAPFARAFELAGDGPRFMQDFALDLTGLKPVEIAGLLIDTPGAKTTDENKDHFIKRDRVGSLGQEAAAMALLCLQMNAPAGGVGHRTSLRGGGPLTTLLIPDPDSDTLHDTLWQKLWLNVLPLRDWHYEVPDPDSDADLAACFPWMAPTRTSEPKTGQSTRPGDVHALQVYWSMPRRIRLDLDKLEEGVCDVTGITGPQIRRYHTRNYGPEYTGNWHHPLSPYYQDNQGQNLPMHTQPGGIGYRHWSALALTDREHKGIPARALLRFYERQQFNDDTRLWAFGYDMDKMKARCWYDATMPVYGIADEEIRARLGDAAKEIIQATEEIAANLRGQLRKAWTKPGATASGDIGFVSDAFWQQTEAGFYELLDELVPLYRDHSERLELPPETNPESRLRRDWHKQIHRVSLSLFDAWALSGDFAYADPQRIVKARQDLGRFNHKASIKSALRWRKSTNPQQEATS